VSDDQDESSKPPTASGNDPAAIEARARMMARVVCICKGITLGRVLKALEGAETVADVNRRAGTGSGGCNGERCGPRIRVLLRKAQEAKGGGGGSGGA
jgi:NAD(P)H-nitrite reductase large subunit